LTFSIRLKTTSPASVLPLVCDIGGSKWLARRGQWSCNFAVQDPIDGTLGKPQPQAQATIDNHANPSWHLVSVQKNLEIKWASQGPLPLRLHHFEFSRSFAA